MDVWLKPNQRALAFALILPLTAFLFGVGVAVTQPIRDASGSLTWSGRFAGLAFTACVFLVVYLVWLIRLPRLAYQNDHLLVYLAGSQPFRVPIETVECFFIGQDSALFRSPDGKEAETATIVVRLAESATQWRHRDVKVQMGSWHEGYITIRGTWCEPIGKPLVADLNRRLVEAHRAAKARLKASSPAEEHPS